MPRRKSSSQLQREVEQFIAGPDPGPDPRPRSKSRSAGASADPLAATLLPPGDPRLGVGRESGRLRPDGISRHDDPYGSTRYLYSIGGVIASGLQVVSSDGREAVIANVYTRPEHRRRGLAAKLLARARRDFARVRHAEEGSLSDAGRGWRDAVAE